MLLPPLITASIERLINSTLYQEPALKAACLRLQGKVLRLSLHEFASPLTLVFSAQRLDVLSQWQGEADAEISAPINTMVKLQNGQQLTELIRHGALQVSGDLRLVQDFVALLDLARSDPAHWLSYLLGDPLAELVSRLFCTTTGWLKHNKQQSKHYLAQTLTEGWRLAAGQQENHWLADDIALLGSDTDALAKRLDRLEGK